MDDIDRAQHREQMDRDLAIRAASNQPARDYTGKICTGCDYASKSSWGKRCDAWSECRADLERRERRAA